MISPHGMWWGSTGSLVIPEYGVTRSLTGSALSFLGPEPALGVSRGDIRKKLSRWLISQHRATWRDLGNTLRQA